MTHRFKWIQKYQIASYLKCNHTSRVQGAFYLTRCIDRSLAFRSGLVPRELDVHSPWRISGQRGPALWLLLPIMPLIACDN